MAVLGHSRRTPQGHDVRTVRVADATGSISMGVWDELGGCISTGDIWRLRFWFSCSIVLFFYLVFAARLEEKEGCN